MNRDQFYLQNIREKKNNEAARREENKRMEELERQSTPLFVAGLVLVLSAVVFYLLDGYVDRQVEKAQAVCLKGK